MLEPQAAKSPTLQRTSVLLFPQLLDEGDPIYNNLPSLYILYMQHNQRVRIRMKTTTRCENDLGMLVQSLWLWWSSTSVCVALQWAWKRTVSEWLNIALLQLKQEGNKKGGKGIRTSGSDEEGRNNVGGGGGGISVMSATCDCYLLWLK